MIFDEGNEITVKIKGNIEDLHELLKRRGYKIEKEFYIDDSYFVPINLKIKEMKVRDILAKAVIVRQFDYKDKVNKTITFKKKIIDKNGDIINQETIDCDIIDIDSAKELLNAIEYKEIMNIKEKDIVYKKGKIKFAIKDIVNGEKLIEIETRDTIGLRNIQELKQTISEMNIPIETDDYFIKKAEIELRKVMEDL